MANPRIDELKRRIEREPGSRLFAQLAEELRKDGDLGEAIRVARSGLAAHPNYPSARLTLGRALFDTGQFGPARLELEAVLRGAPDSILAARMLAECLEGLGDAGAALLQYRAALRLSPGDKQIEAQVRALEQRLVASGVMRAAAPSAPASRPQPPPAALPAPPSPAAPAAPPPRAPAAAIAAPRSAPPPASAPASDDFDDVFEAAPSWVRPVAPVAAHAEAILLVEEEGPVRPGAPPSPPPPGLERQTPEGLAAPVTLAFEDPPLVPAPPPTPDQVSRAHADLRADRPAGSPAPGPLPGDGPGAAAVPLAPTSDRGVSLDEHGPSPQTPAESGSRKAVPSDDGASTAAFAALPKPAPPPAATEPSRPDPSAWEWDRLPPSPAPAPSAPPALPSPAGLIDADRPREPQPWADAPAEAPSAPDVPLSTPTLAELYFEQGFFSKAVEVYEQLLEREPHNERVRARLIEVKAMARTLDVPPAEDPRAAQRQALQRKIARLEQMLAAVRRG